MLLSAISRICFRLNSQLALSIHSRAKILNISLYLNDRPEISTSTFFLFPSSDIVQPRSVYEVCRIETDGRDKEDCLCVKSLFLVSAVH